MKQAVFGIVGWKNCGKTTLTERLIAEFTSRGLSVSSIKHTHHNVDIDQPSTDSFRHRVAGANEVMLVGGSRLALMREYRASPEPRFSELLMMMRPCDLILVEGYKQVEMDKIEVHRQESGRRLWAHEDLQVRAIASDCQIESLGRPLFSLDAVSEIADFIWETVSCQK
jgi:molybdopterin-guanine dinucleotide biosynthesis adapter protein